MPEGFFSNDELTKIGFAHLGEDVHISAKASIYGAEKMIIGNHIRIDDFSLLIGNIELHDYIHIGAYCGLHASKTGRIIFEDFSGISSNVTIYASSDNFDGEAMTARPGIPEKCINTCCGVVRLGKYSQIGTGSTVLPHGSLGEGAAVGAMSLVNKFLDPWNIYAGIPCKFLRGRSKKMLDLVDQQEKKINKIGCEEKK